MEDLTIYHQRMEALCHRARAQVDALAALNEIFAQEAEYLCRHDQVRRLDELGEKVTQEVRDVRRMETTASLRFSQGTLISSLVNFAVGSLVAGARHSREHPLSIGIRLALSEFERTAPFGGVVVALGSGGVPDDVTVVALSRLARELGMSESEILAAIETRGYRLTTPEALFSTLDKLKEQVLTGRSDPSRGYPCFLPKPADEGPKSLITWRVVSRWRESSRMTLKGAARGSST